MTKIKKKQKKNKQKKEGNKKETQKKDIDTYIKIFFV